MKKRSLIYVIAAFALLLAVGVLGWWWNFRRVENIENVENCEPCLRAMGWKLSTLYWATGYPGNRHLEEAVTIRSTLLSIKAYCKDGQIYDRFGRPVQFAVMHFEHPQMMRAANGLWKDEADAQAWEAKGYHVIRMWEPGPGPP